MERYVVIDTETTGLDPFIGSHRIIEIGAIEVVDGVITGNEFHSYVNPEGKKSNKKAFDAHKINDDFLVDKPTFNDVVNTFLSFIKGSTLIFFNKTFDHKFLQNEITRSGVEISIYRDFKARCLMQEVSDRLHRNRLSLDDACSIYHIDLSSRTKHGALIDAKLTAELLISVDNSSKIPLNRVPKKKQRAKTEKFPFPRSHNGIQLNFCKNTYCENYGIPATQPKKKGNGTYEPSLGNGYLLQEKVKKDGTISKSLYCKKCKTKSRLINNRSFFQEASRIKDEFSLKDYSCPNTGIPENKRNGTPEGRRYKKINKMVKGREREFNRLLPPCENSGIGILSSPELYWFDSKNRKDRKVNLTLPTFNHPREDDLFDGNDFASQTFKCKKCHTKFSVPLNAQKGQSNSQINYKLFAELVNKGIINRIMETLVPNPRVIYDRIEFFYKQCIQFDQYQLHKNIHKLSERVLNLSMDRQHFDVNWQSKTDARRTRLVNTSTVDNDTRFVLASTLNFDFTSDYAFIKNEMKKYNDADKLDYKRRYSQYIISPDLNNDDSDFKISNKNLLVHQTYSILAHLEYLKRYFDCVKHINLSADQDSGFELSICKVLKDLIQENRLSAMLIRDSRLDRNEFQYIGNELTSPTADWVPQQSPVVTGKFLDVRLLTPVAADAFANASLHGVDNFFQILRRRINMLERPVQTQSRSQVWNGYGSYNPKYISMLVEIFRVYNNYVMTDKKKLTKNKNGKPNKAETPAQKLGLVDSPFSIYDIIEYTPAREVIRRDRERLELS